MVYFIEIFGNNNKTKYERIPAWLVANEGIVTPSLRDSFSASGQGDLLVGNKIYKDVPKIFLKLIDNFNLVLEILSQTSAIELSEFWGIKTTETKKTSDWIELVSEHSRKIKNAKHLNIKQILIEIIASK